MTAMIETIQAPALTAEQIAQYHDEGYLVIDAGIPETTLDAVVSDLSPYWNGKKPARVSQANDCRIQDAWRISPNVHEIAVDSHLLEVFETLYGRKPRPFQTLNFPKGTQQKVHSDTIHFNSEPFGFMCGVWIALEDIGMAQGPLVYYPGSQKLPEMNFADFGLEASYANYVRYESCVERLIAERQFRPAYGTIMKGQAIVWSANLLHGGSHQHDMNLTRHSQVTHYYFEHGKYWRPSRSKRKRAYFEPDWIPLSDRRWGHGYISSLRRALLNEIRIRI